MKTKPETEKTEQPVIKQDSVKKPRKAKHPVKTVLGGLINALEGFGRYILIVLVTTLTWLFGKTAQLMRRFWSATMNVRKSISKNTAYLFILVKSPFSKFISVIKKAGKDISEQRKEKGLFRAILTALGHIMEFIFGKRGLAVTIFNYGMPIISLVFLFNLITYATEINYAVKLTVNGQFIGYIENEQVFYDAETELKNKMNYLGSDTDITFNPEYSIEKIGYNETLTKYQVSDNMLKNSGVAVDYGYGFYINNSFLGAVTDNTQIKKVLADILGKYQKEYPGASIKFVDDIRYLDTMGLYLADSFVDASDIVRRITATKQAESYYTIEDGDSHSLICDKLDMTMAEMELINPGYADRILYTGETLMKSMQVPYLSVSITLVEDYDIDVDYPSTYYDDSSLYIGTTRITRQGVPGVNHVSADVEYINGNEFSRVVTKSRVVSQPIAEEIAVGTKPAPVGEYSGETAGYGKFIWPVNGGHISEYTQWDGGYYGHCGIDIAGPYGTSIYAGATGVVTLASSWYYDYGMCVMIQHDNGLTTLYAHCSSIFVTVGQTVTQGECIAAIGATGRATGNHLHFEVRSGSVKNNPIDYLDRIIR